MRYKIFILLALAMVLQLLQPIFSNLPAKAQSLPVVGTRLGVGMEAPNYWSSNAMYIDYLYAAGGWNPTAVTAWTADGYPAAFNTSLADWQQSSFTLDEQIAYPAGDYQFYGKGSWDVYFNGDANVYRSSVTVIDGHRYLGFKPGSVQVSYIVNGSQTTRIVTGLVTFNFSQTPVRGIDGWVITGSPLLLTISNVDSADLPDEFHMIRPDYPAWPDTQNAPGYPFGKEFLQSLAPFCGIRFGWDAFSNGITDWSTRPDPNQYGTRCTCIERMIDMANATGCDMWYCLPFNATADFDKNFANLVKSKLRAGLHCHYEVSDELWNWGGLPYWTNWNAVDQMAQNNTPPAGLPSFYPAGAWDKHGEAMGACLMAHAVNIQPILGVPVGRPMMAGFIFYLGYEANGLKYIQQQMGINPGDPLFPYAIAAAPYFGSSVTTDLGALFKDMSNYISNSLGPALQQQMALANQYGIKYCCYEMGQSLFPNTSTWPLYDAAQYDSGMGVLYLQEFTQLKNMGADLCNYGAFCAPFTATGFWGLMESMLDLKNPPIKYSTAAGLAATCNCGNAAPPPPPPSPPPPPPPNNPGGNSGNGSGSSSSSASNGRWMPYGNPYGAHGALGSPAGVPWMQ